MDEYYLLQDNEQRGPFTLNQLRTLWRSGKITGETLYSQPGFEEWMPLSDLAEWLAVPSPVRAPASSANAPRPSAGSAAPFVVKPSLVKSAVAKKTARITAREPLIAKEPPMSEKPLVTSTRKLLPVWITLFVVMSTALVYYIHRNSQKGRKHPKHRKQTLD